MTLESWVQVSFLAWVLSLPAGWVAAGPWGTVAAFLVFGSTFVILRRKQGRLLNPDYAPPAMGAEPPHTFQPGKDGFPCCMLCGGGKLHTVHFGKAYTPKPIRLDPKTLKGL